MRISRQILAIIVLVVLAVSIPTTIYLVKQQQNLRSKASGTVTLKLDPVSATKNLNDTFDVVVSVDGGEFDVSGLDINLSYNPSILQLNSFSPSGVYNSLLLNGPPNNNSGQFRFIEANSSTTPIRGSNIILGTLHFQGKALGTSQVTFGNTQITASGQSSAIPTSNNTTGSYTIVAQTTAASPSPTNSNNGLSVSLVMSPASATKTLNENFDVAVNLSAGNLDISGADVTLQFNPSILHLSSFSPSSTYNSVILNSPPDNIGGNLRFIIANTSTSPITGNINLGTLHFQGKALGTGQVTFGATQITASGQPNAIATANNINGSYTIVNGSSPTPVGGPVNVTFGLNPSSGAHQLAESFDVQLTLDTAGNNLSFVDSKVTYPKDLLTLSSFTPSTILNTIVTNGPPDNTNGLFHYAAGNNSTNQVTGSVNLGVLHFTVKSQGTAQVTVSGNEVTVKNNGATSDVQSNNGLGIYTLSGTAATCQYQSTSVSFRTSSARSWANSGSVTANQPVFIAGFHNGDNTTLPNDVTLSVQDPNFSAVTVPSGNNVSFTPSQPGTYVIRASTNSQSGPNCVGQVSLTVNQAVSSPAASAAVTTTSFKLAESIGGLLNVPWQPYVTDPTETTFKFADSIPGAKQVCDQFMASDGSLSKPECITLTLVTQPTITGCNLNFDAKGNVSFTIIGQNFGNKTGSVSVNGNNSTGSNLQWADTEVTTQVFSGFPAGKNFPVTLTTSDGVAATGICSPVSQLALTARLFCPQVTPIDITNVQITLAEGISGGKVYKQTVTLSKDGVITGLTTKLVEGRTYLLGIKVPKGVRKDVQFTAVRDTTNVDLTPSRTNRLALGDVFPLDGGDGVINSADKAEMNREWIVVTQQTGATVRQSDLNNDKLVNSFDWSCMRQDFNSEDDPDPTAGPLSSVASPVPGSSTSSTGGTTIITSSPAASVITTVSPAPQASVSVGGGTRTPAASQTTTTSFSCVYSASNPKGANSECPGITNCIQNEFGSASCF